MEAVVQLIDSSFKYILLAFNLVTLLVVYIMKKKTKIIKQHHILFVFAHPDDQAMFFGPTLTTLTHQYFIHFLCLSNGNTIRSEELGQSAKYFGVHKYECLHNENMIDGMKSKWCESTITSIVKEYVQNNNIKAIFTFDQHGISGHLNHRAIYSALSKLQVQDKKQPVVNKPELKTPLLPEQQNKNENEKKPQQIVKTPIKIYYLQTTNIIRKYTGLLQLLIVPFKQFSWVRFNYFSGYNSMSLHKSQFVWFRKLFVFFSRYTYINTYQMRKVLF